MIYVIIIVYITFLFIQLLSFKNKDKESAIDKKINFNIENKNNLDKLFKKKLLEYTQLLNHMDYDDWIKYIQNNNLIYYKGKTYYFFLYEFLKEVNKNNILGRFPAGMFISKASFDFEHVNITWQSIINITKDWEKFTKYLTNDNWAATAYLYSKVNKVKEMDYYWINPETNNITRKKSFFLRFKNKEEEGFIGIGYDIQNLGEKKLKNIQFLDKKSFALGSFISLIIAIIVLFFNKKYFFMPFIALFIINIYMYIFTNTKSTYNSVEAEKNRTDQVNRGVLSISFLTAVNIFMITFAKKINIYLFKENLAIFGISLILLLIAIYKQQNYNSSYDLLKQRINKEFYFNFVIILNIYLVINFTVNNLI